jgi:hypothetical protein|tara:strand:+ start:321 stop:878 length:558 start_codon:yes stop_codon:yes gene_type:complete
MHINKVGWTYFSVVENFLTAEECKCIIDSIKEWQLTQIPAGKYSGRDFGDVRRKLGVPPKLLYKDKFDWIFGKFNHNSYKFNLIDKHSHMVNQYHKGDILEYHTDEHETVEDLFKGTPANRLSCCIYLNDNFEGGEFELEGIDKWKPQIGTAIIFPSAQSHRSNYVRSGTKFNYTVWKKGVRGAY